MWAGCPAALNTLRPRQHGCHFADDTFKHIFLNGNTGISIRLSLKFDPQGPSNNIPALVQIMAWCQPGHKPLSEPMLVSLLMHICITRPQWVNGARLPCLHEKEWLPHTKDMFIKRYKAVKFQWNSSVSTKFCWQSVSVFNEMLPWKFS